MTITIKKTLLFIITLVAFYCAKAQEITGDWHGILKVQGMQLRLILHISKNDEGLYATLDSPDQNAKGLPVNRTTFENPDLRFEASQLGIVYHGTLEENGSIIGTFTQRGQSFPLKFSRTIPEKESYNRPQEPKQPYPYYTEDVSFPGDGGKIRLSGTLSLPERSGTFPVAILISGSGPQNRDEEFMTHKPFLVLADHLTRNGIAVLRYDDRGVAPSTGDHMSATSKDFAEDVKSAVRYLKLRKEIDQEQIGLIGHSEGGLIAPMVAAESAEISYIVLLAGPGARGDQILLQQAESMGKVAGLGVVQIEQEKRMAQKIFDIVKQSKDAGSIALALRTYLEGVFEEENAQNALKASGMDKDSFINMQIAQCSRPWYKFFIEYDPATSLKKVTCPVLAINGDLDVQVDPVNLKLIEAALNQGGNKNITIRELPGMNHLFQECQTGAINEYATIEQTFSPVALNEISTWILNHSGE